MNRRSAVMLAGGLVLTLIVGGLAVATGLTGPAVSDAETLTGGGSAEPIVRTVRRTVTVHRKADAVPGEVVQVQAPSQSTDRSSASAASEGEDSDDGDDSHEDESSHDEYEHEDHDDDD
jgi:hypothetical protein